MDDRSFARPYIQPVWNTPTPSDHREISLRFPNAMGLLTAWESTWRSRRQMNGPCGEPPRADTSEIGECLSELQAFERTVLWPCGQKQLYQAVRHIEQEMGRRRDLEHHYIDDAHSAMTAMEVEGCVLAMGDGSYYLVEKGPLGNLLNEIGEKQITHLDVNSFKVDQADSFEYWRDEVFAAAMRRKFKESPTSEGAAETLLEYARSGARKAFVKAIAPKAGTWTIDLADVVDMPTATYAFHRDTYYGNDLLTHGYLVQEHLPLTREQRFFVVDGRVRAGVCSDRNLNYMNRRNGRRLDDRVAVIVNPEVDRGAFDRGVTGNAVDRPMAAAFAREARRIARLFSKGKDGRRRPASYVIDIGMSERGVVLVEMNSFYRSGPYCLDRKWLHVPLARVSSPLGADRASQN